MDAALWVLNFTKSDFHVEKIDKFEFKVISVKYKCYSIIYVYSFEFPCKIVIDTIL